MDLLEVKIKEVEEVEGIENKIKLWKKASDLYHNELESYNKNVKMFKQLEGNKKFNSVSKKEYLGRYSKSNLLELSNRIDELTEKINVGNIGMKDQIKLLEELIFVKELLCKRAKKLELLVNTVEIKQPLKKVNNMIRDESSYEDEDEG